MNNSNYKKHNNHNHNNKKNIDNKTSSTTTTTATATATTSMGCCIIEINLVSSYMYFYMASFTQCCTARRSTATPLFLLNEYKYKYICKRKFQRIWIQNFFISRQLTEYKYSIKLYQVPSNLAEYVCSWPNINIKNIYS